MSANASTPRDIDFDDLRRILKERGPRKRKFVRSKRCIILVVIGILLSAGVIALLAKTYTIAFAATTATTASVTTANTETSSPITSTINISSFQIITKLNDSTIAIWNSVANGMSYNSISGTGVGNYAPNQGSAACVDFDDTTYLNYGNVGLNSSAMSNTAGVGTGLHTTPQVGVSIVQAILFQAGNDSANRDPLNITLEGSNATGTNLYLGSFWTLIYTGATGLTPSTMARLGWGEMQNFTNTQPFTSYRMIVTAQSGVDYCTEFAEMHLYGII